MSFLQKFTKYDYPKLGYIKIPKFSIPADDFNRLKLKDNCTSDDYLLGLIKEGFQQKLDAGLIAIDKKEIYFNRLEMEFGEISRLLFTDYILLVYRIIRFCKENKILNGYGRGSASGSCIFYVLDCTKVDPIKYELLFERFVSASRTEVKEINGEKYIAAGSLADFDLDSIRSRKHEINEFLEKQFPNRTAAISNYSTFQSKVLLKEVLKCYSDYNEDQAKEVSDLIEVIFGKIESIEDSVNNNPKFKLWADKHPQEVSIVKSLKELNKNVSVHASGIILCNDDINDCMPLQLDSQKNIVSCFDMEYSQLLGIKFDNLGLKSLDIVDECLNLVGKKMEDIDVNHKSIYEYLNTRDTYLGLFQSELGLGKSVMQKLKCKDINDLSLSIAIGRPGSMKFLNDILDAKDNGNRVDWGGRINKVLEKTYNCIIYQEDVMALCRVMANFSPIEANAIRKIIGKKKTEEMPLWEDKFISQSLSNGFSKEICQKVWQTFLDSGNYLFCKGHSTTYCHLTSLCCFLKCNHTKEFYYSLLKNAKHEAKPLEEIQKIYGEMCQEDIKLLPPHILKSDMDFTIEDKNIRMGLANVKGISDKAIEKLKLFKSPYSNKFQIFQAANECKIPINIMIALIMVGSLDDMLTETRSKTMMECCLWNLLTEKEKKSCLDNGKEYNFHLLDLVRALNNKIKDIKGKFIIKDSRLGTIRKKFQGFHQIYKQNSKNLLFTSYFFENSLLGFSYSTSLLEIYKKECPDLINLHEANTSMEGEQLHIVGRVLEFKDGTSAKGNKYWRILVTDGQNSSTILFANSPTHDKLSVVLEDNGGEKPIEDDIVVIRGVKGSDIIFGKHLSIQKTKIFEKISQIKEAE